MIESLVAVAIVLIMVVGILNAAMVGTTASSTATMTARMNALATAFGEAIKALPYISCSDFALDQLDIEYQTAFNNSDVALGASLVSLQEALNRRATLSVIEVNALADDGSVANACLPSTIGTQEITLRVEVGDGTVERTVVKRDPSLEVPIDFWPITETQPDTENTPLHLVGLDIGGAASIDSYSWWCYDTDWANPLAAPPGAPNYAGIDMPPAEITGLRDDLDGDGNTDDPDRKGNSCTFAKEEGLTERSVVLRVWTADGRIGTKIATIEVPALPDVPDSGVTLSVTSSPACLTNDVATGAAEACLIGQTITFRPFFSAYGSDPQPPPSQRPAFKIDFGDGRVLFCQPAEGDMPSACDGEEIEHTYSSGAVGRLVLIELLGELNPRTGERFRDAVYLTVLGDDVNVPVPIFTVSAGDSTTIMETVHLDSGQVGQGDAPYLIAPGTTVAFDASASYAAGQPAGSGIVSYQWDFGDGSSAGPFGSPYTTHYYAPADASGDQRQFEATLTVTDASGVSASTVITIVVNPLAYPRSVFVSPSVGRRQCGFLSLGVCTASIQFNWTTVPRMPGERIQYGVRVSGRVGTAPFYACFGVVPTPQIETFWFDDLGSAGAAFSAPLSGRLRFCAGEATTYELQTRRFGENGVLIAETPWSNPVSFTLTG